MAAGPAGAQFVAASPCLATPCARLDELYLHVRTDGRGPESDVPMPVDTPKSIEFELENFIGRCVFLHRPNWTYDNPESAELYPHRQLFHNRKRLWEWRLQGRFKTRPKALFIGIELEEYVPVNFATRSLMRGILPLIQTALHCKMLHHDVGDPKDSDVRPAVVVPFWAADLTIVHDDPDEIPELNSSTLPPGMNRAQARKYWEDVWDGGGGAWENSAPDGRHGVGPMFTFALWGPSQLLDLRTWVFRKLPLMWGRDLSMEPFCGKQPVHAVVYELKEGRAPGKQHRQRDKTYVADLRFCPPAVWEARFRGDAKGGTAGASAHQAGAAHVDAEVAAGPGGVPQQPGRNGSGPAPHRDDDTMSFCSAMSHGSHDDAGDAEHSLLHVDQCGRQASSPDCGASALQTNVVLRSPSSPGCVSAPAPLIFMGADERWMWADLLSCLKCRRRRGTSPTFNQLV